MKNPNLGSDLYCAFVWAVFTLGASHLALVLAGPVIFIVVIICCAVLFASFLFHVKHRRSRKQIARRYLFSTLMLLIANTFYVPIVFLKSDLSYLIFIGVHVFLFLIALLVTLPFLRKSADVSQ